ncbi:pyridoxamine 5'-phosphate oxidase family protein [Chelatococcus reniformis]|uniref:Pyridoxamine 5'-phosphate oxidase n=1 Tax=Chelatococcus reniformis TaxID=1494448 RepID=A0A916U0M7_9HYPH|nr:pyridoxamine 5'-phosphate oxidase family protein [Chelatococcus reniformis]GGC53734.1 pyridoxamine 5'-phosphate oxidase [Chelatococcus reniformis]
MDHFPRPDGAADADASPGPGYASDVAFTPTVKAVQARRGSRAGYAKMEERGSWQTRIEPDLAQFIESQISVFLATANGDGQPYIQHRGGPPGFLKVLDPSTIGFADFSGNRQYITLGNLTDNPKAFLFLIDYVNRQRVKIWGEARVVEGDGDLMARLMPQGYKARPEQVILFSVAAYDMNCPQHIPQRFDAADVAAALTERERRIIALEAEVKHLEAVLAAAGVGGGGGEREPLR